MTWQPLPVLTWPVGSAGWAYLVGCSRDNMAIPNGNPAERGLLFLGIAETFALRVRRVWTLNAFIE
jgi:hypothetical protein